MTETVKRILTVSAMLLIAGGAVAVEYFGFPVPHLAHLPVSVSFVPVAAVRWLMVAAVAAMAIEFVIAHIRAKQKNKSGALRTIGYPTFARWASVGCRWLLITGYWLLMGFAAYHVGARPWIVLLLLLTISAADIGAWFFGRLIGGDKMWERLSAGKTWTGQIAGILCGTFAAVMYGLLGTDTFMPQLMWIGIGVSLFSQYGDLTASWIKRKLGIKDFGNILPGHGGLLDRFDGWIYVLPLIWLVMI